VIGWLAAKYKGAALVEGAATRAAGLLGIPPNIVALLTLNLRAIGEYATFCGFDISRQEERLFAMNVLGLASSPTDASKGLLWLSWFGPENGPVPLLSPPLLSPRDWLDLSGTPVTETGVDELKKALPNVKIDL